MRKRRRRKERLGYNKIYISTAFNVFELRWISSDGSSNRSAVCWHTNSRRDIYDLFSFTHDLEENSRPDNLYRFSASTMSAQFLDYCFGCVISFTVKAVDNVDGANGWHRSRFSRNDSLEFSEFSLDIDHFRPVHILDSFLPFFSFEMISIDYLIVEGVDRTLWNFETRLKFLNFFLFPFESIIEIFERVEKKEFLELKFDFSSLLELI